jgi:hypothetical protein
MIKLYDWILFAANASLMDESAGRLAHMSVNNKADGRWNWLIFAHFAAREVHINILVADENLVEPHFPACNLLSKLRLENRKLLIFVLTAIWQFYFAENSLRQTRIMQELV